MATKVGQVWPAADPMTAGAEAPGRDAERYPSWEDIARASQLTHLLATADTSELRRTFSDERKRHRLLERLRWPEGFVCRRCRQPGQPRRPRPDVLICRRCDAISSVTHGTVLFGAPGGVEDWFDVLWAFARAERSLDAETLRASLELANDEEAELLRLELRAAVARAESGRLHGVVEVDSRILDLGHRRAIVLIATERREGRCGRTRLRAVPHVGRAVTRRFVGAVVGPGSTVRTDCWSGYAELPAGDYQHEMVSATAAGGRAGLIGVDRTASLLRRWLRTHGAIATPALGWHLDEFCLRFNHQGRPPGSIFCALLEAIMQCAAPTSGSRRRNRSGVRRIALVDEEPSTKTA